MHHDFQKDQERDHLPAVSISPSEWSVLRILWKHGKLNACQVAEKLEPENHWSIKTVRTFLSRLLDKNLVGREKVDGVYQYFTVIDETEALKRAIQKFLDDHFGGSFERLEDFWKKCKIHAVDANL